MSICVKRSIFHYLYLSPLPEKSYKYQTLQFSTSQKLKEICYLHRRQSETVSRGLRGMSIKKIPLFLFVFKHPRN